MGEIPSWLIELAESAENDDADLPPNQPTEQIPESGYLEEPVTLMDELRSQVEPMPEEQLHNEPDKNEPKKQISLAGMLPWQQAVLSVMLFLDIAVIGLLFLAMLGRIAIP
ncbi:MAG: hypothetical protein E4H27_10610 [Anaerolineales bacterium]|nr:MAG: hypothetical protein E4H27_10610 [Anaerolineales bacterium]